MDRIEQAEDGIEELGVASVETKGTDLLVFEAIGRQDPSSSGISAD